MVLVLSHSLQNAKLHVVLALAANFVEVLQQNAPLKELQVVVPVDSSQDYNFERLQEVGVVLHELWPFNDDRERLEFVVALEFAISDYSWARSAALIVLAISFPSEAVQPHRLRGLGQWRRRFFKVWWRCALVLRYRVSI